ncbi:hypothetical protein [Zavarzinella formosa]|uniref:hypothetical protein n=1 Tax=Zavarzinella formosa TaxID=360055 RepID=UPI0003139867|nr:hypothetical protein [Zavarzinella formosa]
MRPAIGIWLFFGSMVFAEPTAVWRDHQLVVLNAPSTAAARVVVASGTEEAIAQRPAIAGEWKALGREASAFLPKYPFQPGGKYRVFFNEKTKFADVTIPDERDKTRPVLTQVFPSGDQIPENTLRFYLVFSKPMSRGDVYSRIRVLDENAKAVDQPFLIIDEELWDADQKRLTLLVDPGRIKQEVKPRLDLGPVFQSGKKFTIVIDGNWPDSNDVPLGNDWRRVVTATPPQTKAPTPKDWKIVPPTRPGEALSITFPVAMDEALLMNCLTVLETDGKEMAGKITLDKQETVWRFSPAQPWKNGDHQIRLNWKLEDVSGNAIDRPFEAEELPVRQRQPQVKTSLIPFAVSLR